MKTVAFIATILIYISRCISGQSEELSCNSIEEKAPYYQLKRHLLCDYDPKIRPTVDWKNKTIISMVLIPKMARYNDWESSVDLHLWLYITWKDHHLTWFPSNFDGIDNIYVSSEEIWTPGIHSLNSNYGDMDAMPTMKCIVSTEGNVICVPPIRYSARCESDYRYWPYDEHNCTLQLGSWAHSSEEVDFISGSLEVAMHHFVGSPEWKFEVVNGEAIFEKGKFSAHETFSTIAIYFSMIRTYSSVTSIVLSPVTILTIVSLTTLWLRPGSTERLILSCVNVLGHILTLHNIHWTLPHTGNVLPNILIFYINSFILSIIALTLTCWLQRLTEWKKQVPTWLSGKISVILATKPGQIMLMNFLDPRESAILEEDTDDNSGLVNSESKKSNWEYVVIVISWISFITFLIIYLVMFTVFFRFPSQVAKPTQEGKILNFST